MTLDDTVLDDELVLQHRDSTRYLFALATAGAQVRRAVEIAEEFAVGRLAGAVPRAVLVATDAPLAAGQRLLTRLAAPVAPAVGWNGADLPSWAGPSDALLVGAVDGRHPRLAGLTEQAVRRGLATAVVAPADSPVAAAAGRAPLCTLPDDLHPRAARWSVLTPLLQALDALGLHRIDAGALAVVADALDATAEMCRPSGESFTNPAKSLAIEFAESRPVIAGAGALAGVAARATAEALQLGAGVAAVSVGLPDDAGRAGALLRGPGPRGDDTGDDDFFRDRVDDAGPQRARLLVIGDDGAADDPALGERTTAQVQLDEVAARRAAEALRRLAAELGVRATGVDVPAASPLARCAAALAFGEFTAAYLGLGLGLDPGAAQPAELAH